MEAVYGWFMIGFCALTIWCIVTGIRDAQKTAGQKQAEREAAEFWREELQERKEEFRQKQRAIDRNYRRNPKADMILFVMTLLAIICVIWFFATISE